MTNDNQERIQTQLPLNARNNSAHNECNSYFDDIRLNWRHDYRMIKSAMKKLRFFRVSNNPYFMTVLIVIFMSSYMATAIMTSPLFLLFTLLAFIVAMLILLVPVVATLFLMRKSLTNYCQSLMSNAIHLARSFNNLNLYNSFKTSFQDAEWTRKLKPVLSVVNHLESISTGTYQQVILTDDESEQLQEELAVLYDVLYSLPSNKPDDEALKVLESKLEPICMRATDAINEVIARVDREKLHDEEVDRKNATTDVMSIINNLDSIDSNENTSKVMTERKRLDDIVNSMNEEYTPREDSLVRTVTAAR